MTDYSKTTDFASKDSLATGDPNKVVQGSELDAEFNSIETASATKYDDSTGALQATQINDSNGVQNIRITPAASAVNYLDVRNAVTTEPVEIIGFGSDTDVDLALGAKGAGLVKVTSAGLSGKLQGIYVGLDTPVSLVSNTSTSSTNWTTVNNATLNSATPSIAKLRIQTKVTGTGVAQGAQVDIATSGQSGALTSSLVSPSVYTAHMSFAPASSSTTYGTTEIDVNLDSNYDFQYGTILTSTAGSVSSAYVNIILVGYYV